MTDNTALAQELETLRSRETQMLGAAISRRNWQDVEAAYNQLRDRQDGPIAAVLRTPAPAPVGGDVVEALKDVLASLVAAHSLLSRSPKTAAPSDKMFDQMLKDYEKSIERGRKAYTALQAQPAPAQGDDVVELDWATAFEKAAAKTARLEQELNIANADHIALWLEANTIPDEPMSQCISWLACRIVEAHERALAAMQGGDAVLAERERCAKIAEAIPTDWRDGTQPGPLSAYRHACREIAAAIRGGA